MLSSLAVVAALRLPYPGLLAVALFTALVGILLDLGRDPAREALPLFALGVATPLAPVLGSGTLLAMALVVICVRHREISWERAAWAAPFLVVGAASVGAEWVVNGGLPPERLVWERLAREGAGTLSHVVTDLRSGLPHQAMSLLALARYLAVPALAAILGARETSRRAFQEGLLLGLLPASAVTALQVSGLLQGLPNQHAYWTLTGRAPGSFSDPNAHGIFAVLVLPLLLERAGRRAWINVVAAGWMLFASFSGSRTFFVGLGVLVVMALWRRGARALLGGAAGAVLLLVALNTATLGDPVSGFIGRVAPVGVVRVLESVRMDTVDESLASRRKLWTIGWHAFRDHPLAGVGFARFPLYVTGYAWRLDLDLGTFTDNANSFYLGILAEMGLAGAAALVLSLLFLGRPPGVAARRSLLVLLVILAMGPHLDFDEVALLSGFLLAGAGTARAPRRSILVLLPLGAAFLWASVRELQRGELGFYPPQVDAQGRQVRFTAGRAQVLVPEPDGQVLTMHLSDAFPSRRPPEPLFVGVAVDGRHVDRVLVPWGRYHRFSWHLPELAFGGQRLVRLEVSRTHRPALVKRYLHDWRVLGVATRGLWFEPLTQGMEYGLYPWERSAGRHCRWSTGRRATLVLDRAGAMARLRLFTLDPEARVRPMKVVVRAQGSHEVEARLPFRSIVAVDVPLPRNNDRPLIRIEAERTFAARRVMPHDPRDLSFALMPWLVLDEAPRGR